MHTISLYDNAYCVNSFQMRGFFWSVFYRIWTEYGDLRSKVQIRENMNQEKLRNWTFLRSGCF